MVAKGRQKTIIAHTTSSPGWVLAHRCQCMKTTWQSSKNIHGPFLRTVLPTKVEVTTREMAVDRNAKVLITPPPRWVLTPKL